MSEMDCLALLREADHERYLACLYLPREIRLDAAAIYLFDSELAQIPWRVSEAAAGEIRIQWWREVIAGTREDGGHPVARSLVAAIAKFALPREVFDAYLSARMFDLYQDPMPDRAALEAYCGETASVLLHLIAMADGAERGRDLADASGHGGIALAVIRMLRNLSHFRTRGQCYLPEDLLGAAGLSVARYLENPVDARHVNAVSAMTALAREHYGKAVPAIAKLDRRIRAVYLPLATAPAALLRIDRAAAEIFHRELRINPLARQYAIGRAALFGLPSL